MVPANALVDITLNIERRHHCVVHWLHFMDTYRLYVCFAKWKTSLFKAKKLFSLLRYES